MKSLPDDEIDDCPAQEEGSDKLPLKAAKIFDSGSNVQNPRTKIKKSINERVSSW